MDTDYSYEKFRRVYYDEGACFVPVCVECGRFVRADETVQFTCNGLVSGPNAMCSKCGRTNMLFEGFV